MIKAVAWDIDGTLVDSEPLHLFALRQVCRAHGVDISDLADTHFVGVHIGNVWQALKPRFPAGLSFDGWAREINLAFAANGDQLREIAGAAAVIQQLAAMDLRQIAVSNSNRAVVDANLDAIGVTGTLEFSISLDDVCEGKPDPFPYRMAAYRLGLHPSEVLAVEDSATGVASARAAGLRVAFLDAHGGARSEAEFTVRALSRLPDLIAELAGKPETSHDCLKRAAGR
ncbi:HAD family hydrolase [Mangrovicoccus algicola]|uniref:HAD family phosphatase n=1 Tax=Mangrovicoccus algicola TaxID=2771008 RepID=A0A8J6YR72_9RHOB|nr:HAD family phosphatase [Mangrovicoccus algicola]MBE3638103.1 HAD family phosphatase [Mangrovicoccus algicola]